MVVEKSLLHSARESFASSKIISLKSAAQPAVGPAILEDIEEEQNTTLVEMPLPEIDDLSDEVARVVGDSFDPIAQEEESLLALEAEVCSYGDTVHYAKKPKIFAQCSGSYLYDTYDTPYT